MRLRLRIERNALPPVHTLWPVKDASCTVAQLLQQVNDVFPLEADTWGLEDYALALAGYDLLHYHVLQETLKDEDELVIKPLKWEDLRSRTMTGRDQISVDGRHLVDGVAFGRPALRAPTRPDVRIPPRKKRKLSQSEELGLGGVGLGNGHDRNGVLAPLLLTNGTEEADSDDESDVEFDPDNVSLDTPTDSDSEEGSGHSHASTSTSSSDDDSSGGSSSSDDSSSDSSSDSDEEEWEGIANSKPTSLESKTGRALPNGATRPKQLSPPKANGTSQSQQKAPAVKGANGSGSTEGHDAVGIPHEGSSTTHNRNARRRDQKRLMHAKRSGMVARDATLAEFREWRQGGEGPFVRVGEQAEEAEEGEAAQANDASGDAGVNAANTAARFTDHPQVDETPLPASEVQPTKQKGRSKKAQSAHETSASIEERRRQLVAAINSGGIDVNGVDGTLDAEEAPEELTSKAQSTDPMAKPATGLPSMDVSARRARLDLAGSQRLLYGSLGVRVPKTQDEKDALQKRLAERARRKAVQDTGATKTNGDPQPSTTAEVSDQQSTGDDTGSWRAKINLTAVECVDEDVTLSEPPFPFHQRWDPQYNRKGKKRMSSTYMENGGNKKRKRGHQQQGDEAYDKYNADGYGDALNYDEEDEDEYWEDGALLNGDDEGAEAEAHDDGFPLLPADLSTLPLLTSPAEAKENDIMTFTELACDESTGWRPQMIARTAKVLEPAAAVDGTCRIQLSTRDVKPPSYDEEGHRVYAKFEMPTGPEDGGEGEADERVRDVVWAEMGEVRMVLRAAETS